MEFMILQQLHQELQLTLPILTFHQAQPSLLSFGINLKQNKMAVIC